MRRRVRFLQAVVLPVAAIHDGRSRVSLQRSQASPASAVCFATQRVPPAGSPGRSLSSLSEIAVHDS